MNTLNSTRVVDLLEALHRDAEAADREHVEAMMAKIAASGASIEALVDDLLADERADYRAAYRDRADNFLAISSDYGRFLYAMARACKASRIVEFYTTGDGRPNDPAYFENLARTLSTDFGEPYGHSGQSEKLMNIGTPACLR